MSPQMRARDQAVITAPASPTLSDEERAVLSGARGPAPQLAMRIVVRMARILGARELVPVASAHIDGCLHHGDGGVEFAERLVSLGGKVAVPTTLNVGALDLLHPRRVRSAGHRREMALRQMRAYENLGCRPTWTCAPYQAGHRPRRGQDVAWGESNAVVFANSVLGGRTNRYGDFMDICCALAGRAPRTGLHLEENRRATVVVDTGAINPVLKERDVFYPVLGTWLGATVGERVAVVTGLPETVTEDQLKAMGAASASSGAVGLFHVEGVTPEAPDLAAALGGEAPDAVLARRKRTPAGAGRAQHNGHGADRRGGAGQPALFAGRVLTPRGAASAGAFQDSLLRLHGKGRGPAAGSERTPAAIRGSRGRDRG